MSDTKRVLAASARPSVLERLQSIQTPVEVNFERTENTQAFQALAWRHAFDLIFVELPLPGLDLKSCLEMLRSSACASVKSEIVLLGKVGHETDTVRLDPRLLELVTPCTTMPQALKVVVDTLHLSDRAAVRLIAETETIIDSVRSRGICQTENVSGSGMLLRTNQFLPLSAVLPFSLQLPDDDNPIHGRGEVVRYADATTEGISGMGVRFFGLDGDGSSRLDAYLGSKVG